MIWKLNLYQTSNYKNSIELRESKSDYLTKALVESRDPKTNEIYCELLRQYWLWDKWCLWTCPEESIQNLEIKQSKEEEKIHIARVPRIKNIRFDEYLQELIEAIDMIPNPRNLIFNSKSKSSNRINASLKQTSYIGVSKNGPNWQSLITINKKKTYIGTFMTEKEAAKAYDFYSMLIHWMRAQTNFRYTKQQVYQLIDMFKYLIL